MVHRGKELQKKERKKKWGGGNKDTQCENLFLTKCSVLKKFSQLGADCSADEGGVTNALGESFF